MLGTEAHTVQKLILSFRKLCSLSSDKKIYIIFQNYYYLCSNNKIDSILNTYYFVLGLEHEKK